LGGFEMIMKEMNKSQDKEIKMETVLVLGSAMQSNPKVKIHAVKLDMIQLLLNHISKSLDDLDSNNINNQDFVSRLLFALSSVLRHFPFGQSQFIRFGGVEVLNKILNSQSKLNNKLKIKVITLANDLIMEKVNIYTVFLPLFSLLCKCYATLQLSLR
jgi:nucleotide exchange factor SIL1